MKAGSEWLYLYIWLFFIYAFIGWCSEVAYAAAETGRFVNRGFLNGPLCPVYGFGVVTVLTLLTPLKDNILVLFVGSVILTSVLEWLTGWILEKTFHQKWWDYTNYPFNISGYICLKFSLVWGIGCLLAVKVIQPVIFDFVGIIPVSAGNVLLAAFFIVIAVDITATVQSIFKINLQLKQINDIALNIRALSDNLGEMISTESISIREKGDALKNALEEQKAAANEVIEEYRTTLEHVLEHPKAKIAELNEKREEFLNKSIFGQKRLLQAFSDLQHNQYKEALQDLKHRLLK
jgi:uncharacterized membrane protein